MNYLISSSSRDSLIRQVPASPQDQYYPRSRQEGDSEDIAVRSAEADSSLKLLTCLLEAFLG
jgi:hypothetical protein